MRRGMKALAASCVLVAGVLAPLGADAQVPPIDVPVSLALEVDQARPGESFDAALVCGTDDQTVPLEVVSTPATLAATLTAATADTCSVDASALEALGATVAHRCEATGAITCDGPTSPSATVNAGGGEVTFTIVASFPVPTTTTTAPSTPSVADTCGFLKEIDQFRLEDPTADNVDQVLVQLGEVEALFAEAAATAPPEAAGDLAGMALAFAEIQVIVAEIAAAQGQPTLAQQARLETLKTTIAPYAEVLGRWAEANCGAPAATPAPAQPTFTG